MRLAGRRIGDVGGRVGAAFFDGFQKYAGCPPKPFLIRLRLQIATALMQESGLTIVQIASRTNCEDPYYLNRFFRRHRSRSPSIYRRELGGGGRKT